MNLKTMQDNISVVILHQRTGERTDEAGRVLRVNRKLLSCLALQFYRRTDDVSNDMEEMDTEFQQKASVRKKSKADVEKSAAAAGTDDVEESKATGDSSTFTLGQLLLTAELRRPLFVACMLQVIQQFSGINAVRYCLVSSISFTLTIVG